MKTKWHRIPKTCPFLFENITYEESRNKDDLDTLGEIYADLSVFLFPFGNLELYTINFPKL